MRHIVSILAIAAMFGLAAPTPAQAEDWQRDFRADMKQAEALAKRSIEEFGRALNEALQRLPRYGMPEMTPEGDIIIRRYPRQSPAPEKPNTGPDIDETSA